MRFEPVECGTLNCSAMCFAPEGWEEPKICASVAPVCGVPKTPTPQIDWSLLTDAVSALMLLINIFFSVWLLSRVKRLPKEAPPKDPAYCDQCYRLLLPRVLPHRRVSVFEDISLISAV
ncbi:hypothetical protein niasHT_031091 [Heterodera trifolii]|uniref:Uncharacterized protein n=1 Tax=Heterodera trifolii TaxID=157864 RepID=A0ABD2ISE4_9BILA